MNTETTGGDAATNAGDTGTVDTTAADAGKTAAAADPNSTQATDAGEGQGQGEADKTSEGGNTTEETQTGAPEAYAAFTMPEGYVLDGERLELANTTFKDLNLTQDQGQKLIDLFVKADGENGSLLKEMIEGQRQDAILQWGEDSKKEYGATYDKIVADAKAGVEWAKQERPGILGTFDKEGWGNHPDALWAFAKLGELSRGSSFRGMGGEASGADRSNLPIADRLFGSK